MHPAAQPLLDRITAAVRAAPPAQPLRILGDGQPWTIEDLYLLAEDEHSYELTQGDLLMMTPASTTHGDYAVRILSPLIKYLDNHPIGNIYTAEAGFELQPPPNRVIRAPDVSFVSQERLPPPDRRGGFWQVAPDLVIEIISPSEIHREILAKIRDYFAAGTRLMWLVYPEEQLVEEYRSLTDMRRLTIDDTLEGGEILPGFTYPLQELFR